MLTFPDLSVRQEKSHKVTETGVHLYTDFKRPANFHEIIRISFSVIVLITLKVYTSRRQIATTLACVAEQLS